MSLQSSAHRSMFEVAQKIAPTLRSRSDEIETARRIPDDLARSLAEQGFYRMWVPGSLGGLEMPLLPSLEVFEVLAQADPSVAWCVAIAVSSTLALPHLPEASAAAIFDASCESTSTPGALVTRPGAPPWSRCCTRRDS